MSKVTAEDIEQLFLLFTRKGQYDARTGEQSHEVQKTVEELFEKDYICCKVENEKGFLSSNYPSEIIVPVEERSSMSKDFDLSNGSLNGTHFDAVKFKKIVNKSNLARCRTRFPAPVILCNGNFVCRSSTLACGGEMLLRDMSGCIFNSYGTSESEEEKSLSMSNTLNGALFTELRSQDIKLLKELSVNYICDLMVENKMVRYGLRVCSSEKIDKENRYCDFKILQLPYPGCEFFKQFKNSNYVAEGLMFDWKHDKIDSQVTLPSDSIVSTLGIHWQNYKAWDLVKLTQNYLKLLITYIIEGSSGILVHCVSGWDRTPLFISLLRMSLWADGKIHQSLTAIEMAYLTLAYDWYLFGHNLPMRFKNGEEILFFCFEFLKFIASDEFSSKKRSRKISSNYTDPSLDILIEEDSPEKSPTEEGVESKDKKTEGSSIFYATLEQNQDNCSSQMFYSCYESTEDSDSVKSVKLNSQNDPYSSDTDNPPHSGSSGDDVPNKNGLPSSSPVPVPNTRPRFDSLSSLGSWQYVSGAGSLLGSVNSKGSSSEINSNGSNSSSHLENGNIGSLPSGSAGHERAEKLSSIRILIQRAYQKAIEEIESSNGEQYNYFLWRR